MKSLQQTRTEALRSILTRAVILSYFSMLTVISFLIVLVCILNTGNNIGMSLAAGWVGVILFAISGLVVVILGAEFLTFLTIKDKNRKIS